MMTFTTRMIPAVALALVAAASAPSAAAVQGDAQIKRGQEVFLAQKCQVCHGIAGKGSKQNPLDGVGAKLNADEIRQWITHPAEMTAKTKSAKKPPMPAKYTNLPAADLEALVAYMQSLK